MFVVEYSQQALKFLKKADKILVERLLRKIRELKTEPVTHDSKSIQGYKEKLFRVRVGDYRILYEIEYSNNKIGIIKIDKRERVYD